MTAITTDDEFRLAAGEWLQSQTLNGTAFVDAGGRKIFDTIPNPTPPPGELLTDITPALAALEAALDVALAEIAAAEELAEALAALEQGRVYLQTQLDSDTPDSLTVLVGNIKPVVDANTYLTQWMTRYLNVWSTATTLPVSMAPTTDALRARYILALSDVIALRKQVV